MGKELGQGFTVPHPRAVYASGKIKGFICFTQYNKYYPCMGFGRGLGVTGFLGVSGGRKACDSRLTGPETGLLLRNLN